MENGLLALVRKGGLTLYARHGTATVGVDQAYGTLQCCQNQRNLSDQGRREAIYYGQMLRYWQIPILSTIRTSPFVGRLKLPDWHFQTAISKLTPSCLKSLC